MNFFATRYNTTLLTFVIANVSSSKKIISVFNCSISPNGVVDLMKMRGVSENDIKDSLIKGDLRARIQNGDIRVLASNINLITFDEDFRAFLNANGIFTGTIIPDVLLQNPGGSGGSGDAGAGAVGIYTCLSTVSVGDVVFLSAPNTVAKADADDIISQPVIGIVESKSSATESVVKYSGEMSVFMALVAGNTYYLSQVPGQLTAVAPSATGAIIQKVGFAKNATTLVVLIDRDYVVVS